MSNQEQVTQRAVFDAEVRRILELPKDSKDPSRFMSSKPENTPASDPQKKFLTDLGEASQSGVELRPELTMKEASAHINAYKAVYPDAYSQVEQQRKASSKQNTTRFASKPAVEYDPNLTPEQVFAAEKQRIINLPAGSDDPNAFTGHSRDNSVGKAQQAIIKSLGFDASEIKTSFDAHVHIAAYKTAYPEEFGKAMAQRKTQSAQVESTPLAQASPIPPQAAQTPQATSQPTAVQLDSNKPRQEIFNDEWARVMNLTKESKDPSAYKGDPDKPASEAQIAALAKRGIAQENMTSLEAHAARKAFAHAYPEREQEIIAEAQKKLEVPESVNKLYTTPEKFKAEPVTYSQVFQMVDMGFRKPDDMSPLPTRGELTQALNDFHRKDPKTYDAAYAEAEEKIKGRKTSQPTKLQLIQAGELGVQLETSDTSFKLGERLHKIRIENPDAFSAAFTKSLASSNQATATATVQPRSAPTVAPQAVSAPTLPSVAPNVNLDELRARIRAKAEVDVPKIVANEGTYMTANAGAGAAQAPTVQAQVNEAQMG